MVDGAIYRIEIYLERTSYVFNTGHKIRLSISSSNAPYFDANPNTGERLAEQEAGGIFKPSVKAHNEIHISEEDPSYVELPLVSLAQLPRNELW